MKQQINLYVEQLQPKRDPLPLARALRWCGAALLLLALAVALCQWLAAGSARQLRAVQQQHQTLLGELVTLTAELQARRPPPALEQRIAQLQRDIQGRQQLLAVLSHSEPLRQAPFLPLLDALSRHANGQLWLQQIRLGQHQLLLAGQTLSEQAVPAWLRQLSGDPALAQFKIDRLQVDATAEGRFSFTVEGQP